MRQIVADGLQEVYFKDGGCRANDLGVEFTARRYSRSRKAAERRSPRGRQMASRVCLARG